MLYEIIYEQIMILYICVCVLCVCMCVLCVCVCVCLCICMHYYEEPENSFTKYTFIKQYSL